MAAFSHWLFYMEGYSKHDMILRWSIWIAGKRVCMGFEIFPGLKVYLLLM